MVKDVVDPALGRLKWYEADDHWVAEVEFTTDHPIEVIVEYHEDEYDQAAVLDQASRWLARLRQRELEYRIWSAGRLADPRWNKDEPMTAADIEVQLHLLSIVCAPNGTAEVFWDDNDRLFYGHSIVTRLGADGECVAVGML